MKIFGIGLLILVILITTPLVFIKSIPSGFQPSLDYSERIYGQFVIEQTFSVSDNYFQAVAMTIRNPNQNHKDLFFKLYDQSGNLRADQTIHGRNLPVSDFVKFQFSPISDSAKQQYRIVLSAGDSIDQEAFEVFLTKNTTSDFLPIVVKGESKVGQISTLNYFGYPNKLVQIEVILGNFIRRFYQDLGFSLIFSGLILLLIAGLVYSPNLRGRVPKS